MPQHTIILFVGHSKILHKHCFQFLWGVKRAARETEINHSKRDSVAVVLVFKAATFRY